MDATPSEAKRARTHSDEDDSTTDSPITLQLNKSDSESKDSTSSSSSTIPVSGSSSSPSPCPSYSDSQGQSSAADHSVLSYYSALPEKLSHWVKRNIEDLNIRSMFQPELSPFDLITRPVPCTGGIGIRVSAYDVEGIRNREKEQQKKVFQLTEFVKRSGFLDMIQNLNYTSFEMLNIDSLLKVNSYMEHCFIPKGLPSNLEAWFRRFDTYGKSFIYVLSRMVENEVQGIPNLEYQYQHLFDTLVKMFGMQSGVSFEPGLPVQTLEMGNIEVKGSPDIIYAHHRINESERKVEKPRIVAVCEVKKDRPMAMFSYESPPSSKTRGKKIEEKFANEVSSSTSKTEQKGKSVMQISEKLVGQHCGELLFNYSQSIGHSSIFGIVVQQTHVTFTELGMTNTQYLKIKEGKFKHGEGDRPTFAYTKPYDFLKKEELEMLIQPFIKFGLEQGQ